MENNKNETPRKVWETPKVFVLNTEGTQAYGHPNTGETLTHLGASVPPLLQSRSVFDGYAS